MEDQVDFLNLPPLHLNSLNKRLQEITQLKEHINNTAETFEQYAEVGKDLCSCMGKLSSSFTRYQEFKSDPTLRSISGLLDSFRDTLYNHYNEIQKHIIKPLMNFVRTDIADAEEKAKKSAHCIDTYFKNVENYVSIKKKNSNELQEVEGRLMASHWQAVESDFMYHRALDLVERKKLIEITANFLAFVNLLGVSFKLCLFDFETSQSAFSALQLSMPESANEVKNYQNSTLNYCKALLGYHGILWQKLHSPFTASNAIDHEGFLWKKGSGFTKSWAKRYFVCHNGELSYYHSAEDSDKPQGVLPLILTCVKPLKDPERRFTFTIISQTKVYTLQALTEWDMEEWMAVIRNNIQYLLDNTDVSGTKRKKDTKEEQSIQMKEDNAVCADCGLEKPSWCCINWGTCICIHCSGVHRSLTTSVSKVRSLTLDKLDHFTNKLVSEISNIRANDILESMIKGKVKISSDCAKEERETFIRNKYFDCSFVDDSEDVDMDKAIQSSDLLTVYKGICISKKRHEPGQTGYTWLHQAASIGNPIVTLLIAYNMPQINILDDGGWSPLSYAAFYGNSGAAEALLGAGADPSISEVAHPYFVARAGQNQSLAAMFLPYWQGSSSIPPQELHPPVELQGPHNNVTSAFVRCATLNILGKMKQ